MNIKTLRFGEIDLEQESIIFFIDGLLGFEDKKKWIIIDNGLLGWIQSIDDPDLAFVVANPFEFYEDYDFSVNNEDFDLLALDQKLDVVVLCIVSVPPKVENMTMNLLAPLVINSRKKVAKQVILSNERYSVRHYVYNELLKLKDNIEQKEAVKA